VSAPVNCVCLHPNQAELIVGDQSGVIHLWDLRSDHNEQLVCSFFLYLKILFLSNCKELEGFYFSIIYFILYFFSIIYFILYFYYILKYLCK